MAEPLTDKELAEFRRRVEGLHDMSLGTSMRVGMERRILATIARLEAQNEAKAAALERIANGADVEPWDIIASIASEALSDAGKGWPEMREQVRRALEVAQSWIRSQESSDPARPSILEELAAALDALKVK